MRVPPRPAAGSGKKGHLRAGALPTRSQLNAPKKAIESLPNLQYLC
jgi:hypothetical protein